MLAIPVSCPLMMEKSSSLPAILLKHSYTNVDPGQCHIRARFFKSLTLSRSLTLGSVAMGYLFPDTGLDSKV